MAVKMQPLLTAAVLGAVDGALVRQDDTNGRVETGRQWATWYEAALVVGGIALEMSGSYQFGAFIDPMVTAGAALLGSRATVWALKQQGGTPYVARGAAIPGARGYVAPGPAYGSVHKQPTDSLI